MAGSGDTGDELVSTTSTRMPCAAADTAMLRMPFAMACVQRKPLSTRTVGDEDCCGAAAAAAVDVGVDKVGDSVGAGAGVEALLPLGVAVDAADAE